MLGSFKIETMTITSTAVFVGGANGQIQSISSSGTSVSNKSILNNSNYFGSGTPYSSTIKSIGFNMAGVMFAGTNGNGIYQLSGNWLDCSYNTYTPNNIVAIATNKQNGHMFAVSPNSGIYRLTNQGSNWDRVYFGTTVDELKCIIIDPSDGAIYVSYKWGIFKSIDDGNNWAPLVSTFQAPYSLLDLYNIVDLGIDGSIYALTSSTLFKSNDKGGSWSEISGHIDFPLNHQFTSLALQYMAGGPAIFIGSSTTGITYNNYSVGWETDKNSRGLNTSAVYFTKVYENGRVFLAADTQLYMQIY
jgi:hypothetical protein